jgi:hypothetical protein
MERPTLASATIIIDHPDPRAEICRQKATECDRTALLAADKTIRSLYADLAKQWWRMAEEVEDLERRFSHPKEQT